MTRDDIIRMAREAGLYVEPHGGGNWAVPLVPDLPERVERFASLVVAAERERIKVANASEIEKINAHIRVLEDAVAAERERKPFTEAELEPIRRRMMMEVYNAADDGDSERYNALKVMANDVLDMLLGVKK